jgi:PKD repeat protein
MRHLKILIVLMLIASTALAGNNVEIRFNYPDNVIYVGVENTVEIWIENDDSLYGMSLGLMFFGYDGTVDWDEGYGNSSPLNEEGDAVDAFGGVISSDVNNFYDSELPDSILFGGTFLPSIGECIPPGTLRLCYTMKFTIPGGQPLGSMCVDNIFFPPAGEWLFFDLLNIEIAPDFYGCTNIGVYNTSCGEHCFAVVEAPAPVADFYFAPDSGDYPLTVDFTDLSLYSPTEWIWDFGDGDSSFVPNPSHIYTAPGTYYPSLYVANSNGSDTKVSSLPIIVTSPPIVPGVEITCMAIKETVSGITDTIPFTVENTGEDLDSYDFTVQDSLGWFISPTHLTFNLDGGTNTIIKVAVIVPNGLLNGTQNKLTATVQSQTLPQVSDAASCVMVINNEICGDVNKDGVVNVSDAVYIINFIFMGGPPPCQPE